MAVAGAVGPADRWVALEKGGNHERGDVIATDPAPLPAGSMVSGDRAILPVVGGQICLRKMTAVESAAFSLEDLE